MSDNRFWGGIFIGALLVGGVWYWKAPSEVGRFQIVSSSENFKFLLDTATGDSWRFVKVESEYAKNKQGSPELLVWLWERHERFATSEDEAEYMSRVREVDKILHSPKPKSEIK